jgi:hypothetical protein
LKESVTDGITELDSPGIRSFIQHSKVAFVYGWNFRSPALLKKHAGKIREYFRPAEEYEKACSNAVEPLRQTADVLVGVHIRHGDYPTLKGGKYFFPISKYAEWMNEMAAQFPSGNVSFLVCSDEQRHKDEFPGLSVGFGPGSPVGDLYSLARCDYIMGPLSTFSQWASFYGGKPLLSLYDAADVVKLERFEVSSLEEIP